PLAKPLLEVRQSVLDVSERSPKLSSMSPVHTISRGGGCGRGCSVRAPATPQAFRRAVAAAAPVRRARAAAAGCRGGDCPADLRVAARSVGPASAAEPRVVRSALSLFPCKGRRRRARCSVPKTCLAAPEQRIAARPPRLAVTARNHVGDAVL